MQRQTENNVLAGIAAGISKNNKVLRGILRVLFLIPVVGTLAYLILALLMKDANGHRLTFKELMGCVFSSLLPKAEERVHFPYSRLIWHYLAVIAVVVFIVALFILVHSVMPVGVRSVDEPELLKQRDVSASDVLQCAKSGAPQVSRKRSVEFTETQTVDDREIPMVSLERLQAVLPNTRFSQKGRRMICDHSEGHYEYGDWGDWVYPSRCYEFGDVDTKAATEIRGRLQSWFPYDSVSQQNTVDRLAAHLEFYQVASRPQIYKTSLYWIGRTEKSMSEIWELWDAIDRVIGNANVPTATISPEKLFSEMDDFMSKNKYGEPILRKSLELIALADGASRYSIFRMARSNYREFDLNQELWTDATDKFLAMTELHNQYQLLKNLQCYYDLYLAEIASRNEENARRKAEYEKELVAAQEEALSVKAAREEKTKPSAITLGIAFGSVLLIAIILALLSIQRLVTRMDSLLEAIKEKKDA